MSILFDRLSSGNSYLNLEMGTLMCSISREVFGSVSKRK
ncbi:unnamed protein product [Arabidopsis thaliana]|uniref:Uncharacterized protein n=2 Tax=Arabidopsis thaliana TaxID=3702 RepID=A0A654FDI5_ARATH|nr:uncharacterized protein AT3G46617 [Arabidopsis thaliana]ANM65377.1 hypothetical protein AT3G46617 [Arabidopsis thaliana]VYS59554.1 unnamed protein product [Arabidopsis thaliana]|eukprot:NP_001327352.1 hypothetical protein AT3G46617 [Arabidopsis thaliana]